MMLGSVVRTVRLMCCAMSCRECEPHTPRQLCGGRANLFNGELGHGLLSCSLVSLASLVSSTGVPEAVRVVGVLGDGDVDVVAWSGTYRLQSPPVAYHPSFVISLRQRLAWYVISEGVD